MSVLHNLEAWWHAIWHHFVHGTLPPAPTVGGQPATLNPPAPTQTPPAPTLPPVAPQHVDQAKQNTPPHALPPTPAPAPVPPAPPEPAVVVDAGWDFKTATAVGGVRGAHTDKAIADIAAAGYQDLADALPKFFCGRFWMPPDFTPALSGTPDAPRFQKPTAEQQAAMGFSDAQVQAIEDVLNSELNFEVGAQMGTGLPTEKPYYGAKGERGFLTYVPTPRQEYTPNGVVTVTESPRERALKCLPFYIISGHPDHGLLTLGFDARTDIDVARYIRSWAISYGVPIQLEP